MDSTISAIIALSSLGVVVSFVILQRLQHWKALTTVYLVILLAVSILQHVAGLRAFWLFTIMQMAGLFAVYMASLKRPTRL